MATDRSMMISPSCAYCFDMAENFSLEFPARMEELTPAATRLREFLESHDVPADVTYFAELAFEELATNTVKYGYDPAEPGPVKIEATLRDNGLLLKVIDQAHPFDPLNAEDPDTALPVEERPIGGLGLFLVRQMADEMTYERVGGSNVVTLVKNAAV